MLTVDVDWAPDFMIEWLADLLIARQVKSTWFVTHTSSSIDRLREYPQLFELGIHPNFLTGSSHGDRVESVLRHCMDLVPDAKSMRTHGLLQSTNLLRQVLALTPIIADVSLLLPRAAELTPVEFWWKGQCLLRVPFFWEDDLEAERANPCWHSEPLLAMGDGIKVFAFHPIHVYLNSADVAAYQAVKEGGLGVVDSAKMQTYVNPQDGTRTLFLELVEFLERSGNSCCIRDIAQEWEGLKGNRLPGIVRDTSTWK